jgi:group I intron endonuclease
LLRNLKNGKSYVGQHGSIATVESLRWRSHIEAAARGSMCAVHCAIRKYGIKNFSAEIIWSGPVGKLHAMEMSFIRNMNTLSPGGYNMTIGGDGVRGLTHSPVSKLKMSESAKRHRAQPGVKELIKLNNAIRWAKPEEHAKASAAQVESWKCLEKRKRASDSAKRRAAKPGEHEKRVERSKLAAASNPEKCAEHSKRMKLKWADPTYRAAMVAAHTGRKENMDTRRAKSVAGRLAWANGRYAARKPMKLRKSGPAAL